MDNINLNIDSYTIEDLENLLSLKKIYTIEEIEKSKLSLVQQIHVNNGLASDKRKDILFFIDTLSDTLKNKILNENSSDNNTWSEKTVPVNEYGSNIIIKNPNEIEGKKALITSGKTGINDSSLDPGWLNPISIRTRSQGMNIDSRFRKDYYKTISTNFIVDIPEKQNKVVSLRVASLDIPLTHYGISRHSNNDTFLIIAGTIATDSGGEAQPWIEENSGVWSATFSPIHWAWLVILPEGNYELKFLEESHGAHIETAMNNAISLAKLGAVDAEGQFELANGVPPIPPQVNGSDSDGVLNGTLSPSYDICYEVSRPSGKSIFARPSERSEAPYPTYPESFNYYNGCVIRFNVSREGNLDMENNIQYKLGWLLGFRTAQYVMQTDGVNYILGRNTVSWSCVSEGVCFPCGPRYGYLSINDFQSNYANSFMVLFGDSVMDKNIIARVNLAAITSANGIFTTTNDQGLSVQLNKVRQYFGPVDIQKLHIRLYDEYGRTINLNNMDWSLELVFEKLYV